MRMPMRLQDNVPEIYVNESRDFQLLCRLYDCIINGVKFDIDSIRYITDTKNCNSRLLDLLKTKIGFYNDKYIFSDDMRIILEAFPYIIKYKGSKRGIIQTICLFLKVNRIKTETQLKIDNTNYFIEIGINANIQNTTILDEILKYIIPTGYKYRYYFYEGTNLGSTKIGVKSSVAMFKDVHDSYITYKDGDKYVICYKDSNIDTEITTDNVIDSNKTVEFDVISNVETTNIEQVEDGE